MGKRSQRNITKTEVGSQSVTPDQPLDLSFKRIGGDLGSTGNKLKWALLGAIALVLANIFFFLEGVSSHFVSMAIPGAILITPLAYDILAEILGKEK